MPMQDELAPGRALAEEFGMPFFATSALTGAGCDDAFTSILRSATAFAQQQEASDAAAGAAPLKAAAGAAGAPAKDCVIA